MAKTNKGKDELKWEGEEVDRPPYPAEHREHVLRVNSLHTPGPKWAGLLPRRDCVTVFVVYRPSKTCIMDERVISS